MRYGSHKLLVSFERSNKVLCYGNGCTVLCASGNSKMLCRGSRSGVPRSDGISTLLWYCISNTVVCNGNNCRVLRLGSRTWLQRYVRKTKGVVLW